MKSIKSISTILVLMLSVTVTATILNVPDEYGTIQQGINASSDGDTVLVQPGTYYENINFFGHKITIGSLYLTTGDSSYAGSTIIDGNSSGVVVEFSNNEDSTSTITGFTIQNGHSGSGGGIICDNTSPNIFGNKIIYNNAENYGGGIYAVNNAAPRIIYNSISNNIASIAGGGICNDEGSSSYIFYNKIDLNTAYQGAGILASGDGPTIEANWISENHALMVAGGISADAPSTMIRYNCIVYNVSDTAAGGILCINNSPTIANNTLLGNKAGWSGGGIFNLAAQPNIINTILWADSANGIPDELTDSLGNPSVTYCCVQGGFAGIGNIDDNPLFCDLESLDLQLAENSPCVGTGQGGADIGVYGVGCEATSIDNIIELPKALSLSQNYPNPFNASTIISYDLPEQAHVRLTIYDILGRQVAMPVDRMQGAGEYQVLWNADDYSTGIYFARVRYLDKSESIKMLMVK